MEIKNLKKAGKRILKAVKEGERIVILSDSDLDGVVSAIIMQETLRNLKANIVEIYFPDRESEGYGISEKALLNVKRHAPALLVASDFGVGNLKEVKIAKKMGFETIIIDHHEILDKVPSPAIVIDPKQEGDKYPFKNFSASGLVFKLSEEILKERMGKCLKESFLELVAIATIADMMPLKEDNADFVLKGTATIEHTWRPGLKVLFEIENSDSLNLMQRISKVNSLLNIRNNQNEAPLAFRILVSPTEEEARKLSKDLIDYNLQKKVEIGKIKEEVEQKVLLKSEKIVFEGDSSWDLILLGTVAGILSRQFKKPVFLHKRYDEESQGGVRAPQGFNIVEAMKSCSDLLETYGGHPQAAGFKVKNENIEKFKEGLIEYFNKL